MPQLAQRFGFNLANAFARDGKALPNFLQCVIRFFPDAEAHAENLLLARSQRRQDFAGLLFQAGVHGRVGGRHGLPIFHEVAESIFDILQAPVWGRSKDAADRLSAFLMLQFGEEAARKTIGGTATFFALSNRTWTGSAFAAVASPEAQRYFNFLCIAYGGAPKSFDYLVQAEKGKSPLLPEDRARRCAGEYSQVRKAFNLRIMPYVDPDMFVRSRAIEWKLSAK